MPKWLCSPIFYNFHLRFCWRVSFPPARALAHGRHHVGEHVQLDVRLVVHIVVVVIVIVVVVLILAVVVAVRHVHYEL